MCGDSVLVFVCYALLCVLLSFATILTRKREQVTCFNCIPLRLVTVSVLWLIITVPLAGLQCVIMAFLDRTHLLFYAEFRMISILYPTILNADYLFE